MTTQIDISEAAVEREAEGLDNLARLLSGKPDDTMDAATMLRALRAELSIEIEAVKNLRAAVVRGEQELEALKWQN